jgi:hypothetical protein
MSSTQMTESEIREMYKNGCNEVKSALRKMYPNWFRAYPYYGKNNATRKIVYFTKPNCGYVIRKGCVHDDEVGYYNEDWIEELFIPTDEIDKIK